MAIGGLLGGILGAQTVLTILFAVILPFVLVTSVASTIQPRSNATWSSRQHIDTKGYDLHSVSCPTTSFCVTVDGAGYEFTYTNGTWSSRQQLDINGNNSLFSVSCATTSFCVAVGDGSYEFTYTNGTWSSGQQIDTNPNGNSLNSVSCNRG